MWLVLLNGKDCFVLADREIPINSSCVKLRGCMCFQQMRASALTSCRPKTSRQPDFQQDFRQGCATGKSTENTPAVQISSTVSDSAEVIHDPDYFPHAKIITFDIAHGSHRWDRPPHHFSNPARMVALVRNLDGFNYLDNAIYHVDGYGTHIYPNPLRQGSLGNTYCGGRNGTEG
jgi:hypothetical protein